MLPFPSGNDTHFYGNAVQEARKGLATTFVAKGKCSAQVNKHLTVSSRVNTQRAYTPVRNCCEHQRGLISA